MSKWRDVKQNRVEKNIPKKVLHSSLNFVSISKRFKAFLTDTFLITTPILYIVIYLIMGSGQEFAENRSLGWGIIFTVHFIIIAIFWLKNGQTPGLKAYDLKLVDSKTETRVSVLQTIIRYSATLFSIISIFFIFTPFVNKEKKTFQDIVSNTKIIEQ
ncbi:RDD family protein [Aliarcobacter cryaerophilus]|uniref:RDD family protein n=1 Tax=Aliarcobacter cryaerophilus TaxID=28198 RepID=UPI0021B261E8|nr:RDD family protein [Aliarcobacter cryaerophilus]MCT7484846.1 RDD family protein [Aliarcobacter cryaerophilus]MCT7526528.1 RDD family protein [Aliarcobacter cryaerophilus]